MARELVTPTNVIGLHTPFFGAVSHELQTVGKEIGGAEEFGREFSRQLLLASQLHKFVTIKYPDFDHRFNPAGYGFTEEHLLFVDNEEMLHGDELVTNDRMMSKFRDYIMQARPGAKFDVTNYYVTWAAYNTTPRQDRPTEIAVGHTWGRSVAKDNPARPPLSKTRDDEEVDTMRRILDGTSILTIPTRAEAADIHDLYHVREISGQSQEDFLKRCVILPFGVQQEFLDLGKLSIKEKEQLRPFAKQRLIQELWKNERLQPEAEKLLALPANCHFVGVIGGMRPGKGHLEALRGFREAMKDRPNLALILTGGELQLNGVYGQLLEEVENGRSELGDEFAKRVIFTDSMVDSIVIPTLSMGLVPSYRESFSFFLAKLAAAGIPFAINRNSILEETAGIPILQQYGEVLPKTFDVNNPTEIAHAILGTICDREFYEDVAYGIAGIGAGYTWDNREQLFFEQLRALQVL